MGICQTQEKRLSTAALAIVHQRVLTAIAYARTVTNHVFEFYQPAQVTAACRGTPSLATRFSACRGTPSLATRFSVLSQCLPGAAIASVGQLLPLCFEAGCTAVFLPIFIVENGHPLW